MSKIQKTFWGHYFFHIFARDEMITQAARNKFNIAVLSVLTSGFIVGTLYTQKQRREGKPWRINLQDEMAGFGGSGRDGDRARQTSYLDRKAGEAWRFLFPSMRGGGGGGRGGGGAAGAAGTSGAAAAGANADGEEAIEVVDPAAVAAAAAAAAERKRARYAAKNRALRGEERKDLELMDYVWRPWAYFSKDKGKAQGEAAAGDR